ncbi:DUF1876 domain-containing protein [Jiangella sp. DSM 45060]|uniref:DUF1876 domain-containing protein n=1 Tax=Jiangella sp. DSM 45060 TaxID=1798224 RepID=UPI00087B81A0|nr:DUF1876 domain-containing protein [Jiangella sp. DSM 45060]SDT14569.1 protein of unknown function [Jiangella sp. DSM 45060]
MNRIKRLNVDVVVYEQDDELLTRAEARLESPRGTFLTGSGTARRNPADPAVPKIGDELAMARAFSDLAHQVLEVAATDIEQVTHQPVQFHGDERRTGTTV